MGPLKNNLPQAIFILLIASLQTLASLLPGFILMDDGVKFTSGFAWLIIYLLFSDLVLVLLRLHKQRFPFPIYIVKIACSLVFIWFISSQLSYQYGIILIAYEVFQFLNFSLIYDYNQRLSYALINAFFKGVVFNLVISLKSPYTFQLTLLQPYLFSFFLILTLTFLHQSFLVTYEQKKSYLILTAISLLGLIGLLFWQQGQLSTGQLATMLITLLISFGYYIWENNTLKGELALQVGSVMLLFIYYFF